jgi:hypothetical protein
MTIAIHAPRGFTFTGANILVGTGDFTESLNRVVNSMPEKIRPRVAKRSPKKGKPNTTHTDEQVKAMIREHMNGTPIKTIADRENIGPMVVRKWMTGEARGDCMRQVEDEIYRARKGK